MLGSGRVFFGLDRELECDCARGRAKPNGLDQMKKTILAAFCLFGIVGNVSAQEAPVRTAHIPAMSWEGFYFGVNAGYAWADQDGKLSSVVGPVLSNDVEKRTLPSGRSIGDSTPVGGIQAGYNRQFGMFVAGLELDATWIDAKETKNYTAIDPGPFMPGVTANSSLRSELDWLATARLRAGGVVFDRALIFATGGVAAGRVKNAFAASIPEVGYSPKPWTTAGVDWGYTVGAGLEYAFTKNLTAKIEYLHFDLGSRKVRATDPLAFPGESISYRFDNRGDILRSGLNFKF